MAVTPSPRSARGGLTSSLAAATATLRRPARTAAEWAVSATSRLAGCERQQPRRVATEDDRVGLPGVTTSGPSLMRPAGDFGPQVCGRSRRRRHPRVAGPRRARRLRDGHRQRAAHPPLPRPARGRRDPAAAPARSGLVALDPVLTLAVGRRGAAGHATSGRGGAVEPGRPRATWSGSSSSTACPGGAGGSGRWCWSGSWRWRTARCAGGVVHRLVAGGPVTLDPGGPVHLARRARRAQRRRAAAGRAGGRRRRGRRARSGSPGRAWSPAGDWYWACTPREEAARGLDRDEDLWLAGRVHRRTGRPATSWRWRRGPATSTAPPPPARGGHRVPARAPPPAPSRPAPPTPVDARAGCWRPTRSSSPPAPGPDVVAGYPWFGAWSRDTMPSYEGLFLATGRAERGPRACCGRTPRRCREGMLANTADTGADRVQHRRRDAVVPARGRPARRRHRRRPTSPPSWRRPLTAVVAAHVRGTRYGIRRRPGRRAAAQGAPGYALTWMDARVDGVPVTQRAGKAVELNALWINGLAALAGLRERLGAGRRRISGDTRRDAARAFARRFPRRPAGSTTSSTRPTATTARYGPTSCSPTPCRTPRWRPDPVVLAGVGRRPAHPARAAQPAPGRPGLPAAAPRRPGPARPRLPPGHGLAVADRAVRGRLPTRRPPVPTALVAGSSAHLGEWGLGSVSARPPTASRRTRATGCPFQAWSVAEVLRATRIGGRL